MTFTRKFLIAYMLLVLPGYHIEASSRREPEGWQESDGWGEFDIDALELYQLWFPIGDAMILKYIHFDAEPKSILRCLGDYSRKHYDQEKKHFNGVHNCLSLGKPSSKKSAQRALLHACMPEEVTEDVGGVCDRVRPREVFLILEKIKRTLVGDEDRKELSQYITNECRDIESLESNDGSDELIDEL